MLKKFYILGLLILGLIFVASGFYLDKSADKKSSLPAKSVLNFTITSPAVSNSLQEKNILKQEQVLIKKVVDGDTVETDKGERIRYLGINAPEVNQPFYEESLKANMDLVLNKTVRLEFDIETKDRYGRTLAYVFVNDVFINLEMIRKGLAVSQTIQPNVKYQDLLVKAQEKARTSCLGIWEGLCKSKTTACIKIVSINADAVGNDNANKNGEWVNIKNTCVDAIPMNGWLLKDSSASNKYQFKNFSLSPQKDVYLYSGCGQDTLDKLYWQCPEGKYAIWNNAGDHAFLYNEKGELVADYKY